ncbi:MAG: ABC transporter permease [Clostridiales bacterium]|jgi:simple sugar transport system permease protein|nr:ABC transporter permease [Clostridiales bacterium]
MSKQNPDKDLSARAGASGIQKVLRHRLFFPLLCLALVLLANVAKTPNFFAVSINNGVLYGYIVDVVNRASELVILAIGMTLATAASGGQDISVGAVMAVSAAVCCQILSGGEVSVTSFQNPLVLAVSASLAASALCGAFNGFLVARLRIQPMVATLILFTAGRGVAQLITAGQITYIRVSAYKTAGGYIPGVPIPVPIFFAIGTAVIVALLLRFTALRLFVEAAGVNSSAARLVGLGSARVVFVTYVICGFLAGLAGFVASSRIYSADANNIGLYLEMDAILAVALGGNILGGGRFSLAGSVIGAFTIQSLSTTLYAMNISADQLPVYKAAAVIAIITLQSDVFRGFIRNPRIKNITGSIVFSKKETQT